MVLIIIIIIIGKLVSVSALVCCGIGICIGISGGWYLVWHESFSTSNIKHQAPTAIPSPPPFGVVFLQHGTICWGVGALIVFIGYGVWGDSIG